MEEEARNVAMEVGSSTMESAASRRLRIVNAHMQSRPSEEHAQVESQPTLGEFYIEDGYSVVLPEKLSTGKWNVHRSAISPMQLLDHWPDSPEIRTLHDNFVHAKAAFADNKCLGTRIREDGTVSEYRWMTYGEVGTARTAIGSGLVQHGIPKGACIGLYMMNRAEWMIAELACTAYSYVSVPLYDTLGADAVKYIINHSEVTAVFCTPDKLQTVLSCLSELPTVRLIVLQRSLIAPLNDHNTDSNQRVFIFQMRVVGGAEHLVPSLPPRSGVEVVPYSRLEAQGKADERAFVAPKPHDLATICYTSGTTGVPKGAMITHYNLIASAAGANQATTLLPSDVHISYLPLAHIYERMNVLVMLHCGSAIGFYQGDVLKLMEDMEILKPTIFCSVPRLYNRIYDKMVGTLSWISLLLLAGAYEVGGVHGSLSLPCTMKGSFTDGFSEVLKNRITSTVKASGGLREKLFNVAYNAKSQALQKGKTASPIWDRLVFNKVKAALGGRVRVILSGASPISPEVLDFLRICFGGYVSEGYGMTETACLVSGSNEGDNTSGHVGSPNPACEIKLADVPEMEYTNDDKPYPRGEVCVRGPIIFKGYYKDEVQTREIFDEEGWLHSGDIGCWLPGGRLKIIDRKKNIFKLAQGEYIAPEKIENVYVRSRFISQCFIHGDSFNSSLVAIAVMDPETLPAWAKSRGIKHADDLKQLSVDPVVRAAVLADMDAVGREAQLRGFEFAKAVTLTPEPFSIENGLLTPTLKVKRPQAKTYFAREIADMYEEVAAKEESQVPRSSL